jgi:hypothetical protein
MSKGEDLVLAVPDLSGRLAVVTGGNIKKFLDV